MWPRQRSPRADATRYRDARAANGKKQESCRHAVKTRVVNMLFSGFAIGSCSVSSMNIDEKLTTRSPLDNIRSCNAHQAKVDINPILNTSWKLNKVLRTHQKDTIVALDARVQSSTRIRGFRTTCVQGVRTCKGIHTYTKQCQHAG